ncbi:hypothetical protein [Nocardioides aurantiacus]|uniref:Uncharacterized protein n=1 Tax=Nocardioides aurantiacus TaxID=86796 RepID=A0A3N2CTV7_9ACTN|nr:hypothetical protein [Nocardioides aurantiacus]ROR90957.1 hypothetical protein EDD33_1814 [Nocardioides aurantiacus]
MHLLGVQPVNTERRYERPQPWAKDPRLDWTVDGDLLQTLHPVWGSTLLDAGRADADALRVGNLRRLRGDEMPLPVFVPRFDRSRIHRLLRLRGTPYAFTGSAFEDGRVVLLSCECGDLDCGAVSTRVEVTAGTVEWQDVGLQVTYEPFHQTAQPIELLRLTFDRAQYEELINRLLAADWSDGPPRL